jgi:hypothetical protein
MKCILSIVEAAAPGGDIDGMAKLISNLPEFNSLFSSFSSGVDLQEVKILKALEKNGSVHSEFFPNRKIDEQLSKYYRFIQVPIFRFVK